MSHGRRMLSTDSLVSSSILALSSISLNEFDFPAVAIREPFAAFPRYASLSCSLKDWTNIQQDIVSIFRSNFAYPIDVRQTQEHIRKMARSDLGSFIYDYYKNHLLRNGMQILQNNLAKEVDDDLLVNIGKTWTHFYTEILPTLELVMYTVKVKGLTIKQLTLVAFRDEVVLKTNIKGLLTGSDAEVPADIKQMLLVLQTVRDTYPPNENYIALERLVALAVRPFLGYQGLYDGDTEPIVKSRTYNFVVQYTGYTSCNSIYKKNRKYWWRRTSTPGLGVVLEDNDLVHFQSGRRHTYGELDL